jgi:hypothetical protein
MNAKMASAAIMAGCFGLLYVYAVAQPKTEEASAAQTTSQQTETTATSAAEPSLTPTKWLDKYTCEPDINGNSPASIYELQVRSGWLSHGLKLIDQGDAVKIERREPETGVLTTFTFYRTKAGCEAARSARLKQMDDEKHSLDKYR